MEVPWHSGTFGISSVQWYTGSTARSPGSPGQQEHRKLQYWAAIPTNSCQSVRGSKKVRKGKELLNDNQKALCLSDSLFKGAIQHCHKSKVTESIHPERELKAVSSFL